MIKKLLSAFLAALLTLSLAACNKEGGGKVDIPTSQTSSADFQKNMHQSDEMSFIETDTGWYFSYGSLYYIDKEDMRATVVCAKPDCDHTDDNICNARIQADYLLNGAEKIYYVTTKFENGAGIKRVEAVKYDATERETVQELKFQETVMDDASWDTAIYHRGYIYYVSDYTIYRTVPGGKKDAAEVVWRPQSIPETEMLAGYPISDPNELDYTLWAEGDTLYFMANLQERDGTYKDMLFACDLTDMTVHQVWITPGKDEAGEWETTGVSVSQWYVTNGYIYFYLSGGDMWRGNLSTGKNAKLADTHEKTVYGKAVFSDDYMLLIDDGPEIRDDAYTGEDALFVYKLDGTFVKELSLKGITDTASVYAIKMLFNAGNIFCFVADAGTKTAGESGSMGGVDFAVTGKITHDILCWLDLETGELTRLTEFTD